MKLTDLSNEELIFIHTIVENRLENLNEILDEGGITYIMDSPLGKVELFGRFSDDELTNLEESVKYKLAKSIIKKLQPIYDLLADGNQDIIDNVRNSLFPETDEDDEKD
jgi:hypothetical protein